MLPGPEQYAAMLDGAAAGGYALPAVNATSSQTLNAAMRGFAEAGSDGIVQITVSGAQYLSGGRGVLPGGRAFSALAAELAACYPVAIAVHTDRCPPEQVDSFLRPLLADSAERIERGQPPLFGSHMFDGSTLPLGENLRIAADLLERCHPLDVILEVECGAVGRSDTTPEELLEVAGALGTGERGRYLVAAAFGSAYGVQAAGQGGLRPEILSDGQTALERSHPGSRFRYVFHGSSGSSPHELQAAIEGGVVKVNLDSETQYAFTRAAAQHMLLHPHEVLAPEAALGDKGLFDPRSWGAEAETAMAARVALACEQLGSAGRSIAG